MDLFQAAEPENKEKPRKSIQDGREVNGKNSYPNPPHEAMASDNQAPSIQALTPEDASLNLQDQEGDTMLHIAAIHGQTESIEALLQSGHDPNIQNRWGDTPLYIAALNGHLASVEALIHAGADPDIQNCWGNTPLYIAALNKHPESVKALLDAGTDTTLMNHAPQTPENSTGDESIKSQFLDHRIARKNQTLTQVANDGLAQESTATVNELPPRS